MLHTHSVLKYQGLTFHAFLEFLGLPNIFFFFAFYMHLNVVVKAESVWGLYFFFLYIFYHNAVVLKSCSQDPLTGKIASPQGNT